MMRRSSYVPSLCSQTDLLSKQLIHSERLPKIPESSLMLLLTAGDAAKVAKVRSFPILEAAHL